MSKIKDLYSINEQTGVKKPSCQAYAEFTREVVKSGEKQRNQHYKV